MKEKNSVGSEVKDWVVSIAAAIVLALLIRTFIVELYIVDGPSMRPTLPKKAKLSFSVIRATRAEILSSAS